MKKEKNIRVIIVEPIKEPREAYIENELHTLQKNVGGYIECISLTDGIDLVLNEEGKLIGLMVLITFQKSSSFMSLLELYRGALSVIQV